VIGRQSPRTAKPGASSDTKALSAIARGGVASLLGSGVSAVSGLVVVLVVTRFYTPSDAGALFAATAVFLITIAIVQLGTDQGLVRFVAAHRARGEHHELRRILRIGLLPVLGASLIGTLVLIGLAAPLAELFDDGETDRVAQMLRVLALAVPIAAVHEAVLAATRGLGSLRSTIIVERILRPLLQPLAIVAVAVLDLDAASLAPAWVAPYLFAIVASVVALRRTLRRVEREVGTPAAEPLDDVLLDDPVAGAATAPTDIAPGDITGTAPVASDLPADVAPTRSLAREFWSFCAARAVARVCQVGLQRVDVILVAALVGTSATAVYAAATRFVAVGMLANQAIQQVIQPRIAAMLARGENRLVQLVLKRTTVWIVALVWPGYLALAVLAPTLMLVFGSAYAAGAPSLAILAVSMLAASAAGPLDVALLMAGRSAISLLNTAVALAVDVIGCLLLLPSMGVTGAAVAWAAAILVRNAMTIVQTRRLLGLSATSRELAQVSLIAALCCGLVPVPLAVAGAPALAVVGALALGVVAYLLVLLRFRTRLGLGTRPDAVPATG